MVNEIDEAVDQLVSTGLASANEVEILRQLDAELQQQTMASAMVLSGDEPEAWVLGGERAGGFGSMAQRFLSYYADALHREICDPDRGCLKDQYSHLLGGQEIREQVKTLAPVVLGAIGVSATLGAPATVAVIVALWLLRVGLQQWCAAPRIKPEAPVSSEPDAAAPSVNP